MTQRRCRRYCSRKHTRARTHTHTHVPETGTRMLLCGQARRFPHARHTRPISLRPTFRSATNRSCRREIRELLKHLSVLDPRVSYHHHHPATLYPLPPPPLSSAAKKLDLDEARACSIASREFGMLPLRKVVATLTCCFAAGAKNTTEHDLVETSSSCSLGRTAAVLRDATSTTSTTGSHHGAADDGHWRFSPYFFQQRGGKNVRHSLEAVT